MTEYFFLCQNLYEQQGNIEIVGHTPVTSSFDWLRGAKFTQPFPKETLMLDPSYGKDLPDLFDTSVPVMSKRLLASLQAAGVDNVDAYDVALQRIDDGTTFDGHVAFNVLGCLDAIDPKKSAHRLRFGKPYYTGAITIDPSRAHDLSLFRLALGPPFVVIADRIAEALRGQPFRGVTIMPTTAYQGA